jgi:hypothetical protein
VMVDQSELSAFALGLRLKGSEIFEHLRKLEAVAVAAADCIHDDRTVEDPDAGHCYSLTSGCNS